MNRRQSKRPGFTLVELLIVVAIIGILSTIGIPTFKRMVQKAKKSEAKVGLGGIYTAEAAFFSEYGAYGTNLDKLGFELEGSAANRFYSMGFPGSADGNCEVIGDTHDPDVTTSFGSAINASFPGFYAVTSATQNRRVIVRAGAGQCRAGFVAPEGGTFTASATGVIAPGLTAGAALTSADQWTIDNNRQLVNIVDGVQ